MSGYDIKLRVKDFRPITWRDLIIPASINFAQLHDIIQECFGFYDDHLYMFKFKDSSVNIIDLERSEIPIGESLNAKDTQIMDYFDLYSKIEYWYDFGDDWFITIEVKKKVDYEESYPTVKRFKGEWNMMDDIGGPYNWSGYIYLLENEPEEALERFLERNIIDINDLTPTERHIKYIDSYDDFYDSTVKKYKFNSPEFNKELEKFNKQYIIDNNLEEEFEEYSKLGNNLDRFIWDCVETYENDFVEYFKFHMDTVQFHLKREFKK